MDEHLYDVYADVAESHWWFEGRRQVLASVIADAVRSTPGSNNGTPLRLLDVGCGAGVMFEMLAQFGHVTGMDMSTDVVELCRQRFGDSVDVQLGRIPEDLPTDQSFDVVGAFDVLEHLEDDVDALVRMRQAARPGGLIVIAVPAFQFLWGQTDVLSHHLRRYRRPQLRTAMRRADLTVERMSYFNTWLFPPTAVVRVGRRLFSSPDREPEADLNMTSSRVDPLLTRVFASERHLLKHVSLPFGVSLLATARVPS